MADAFVVVGVFAIARRPEIADFVAHPLDLAGEALDGVPGDEYVGALPGLLCLDAVDSLAVGGEGFLDAGRGV